MLRMIFLGILVAFAIFEYFKPVKKLFFGLLFGSFTLLLVMRCGQGIDYFSYSEVYYHGWKYTTTEYIFDNVMKAFHSMGFSFPVFIIFITLVIMALLYVLLVSYSEYKCMSLLIVYSFYYLSYFESSVRQLLALLVGLVLILLAYRTKRIYFALIALVVVPFIHVSAVVMFLFLVPYVVSEKFIDEKIFRGRVWLKYVLYGILCVCLLAFSVKIGINGVADLLPTKIQSRISTYLDGSYNKFALLNRAGFLCLIGFLYYFAKDKVSLVDRYLFRVYLVGFVIFCALFSVDLLASRFNMFFKFVEIILLPNLLVKNILPKKAQVAIAGVCVVLLCGYYCKQTKSTLELSKYHDVNYFNYPYFSYFNIEDMKDLRDNDAVHAGEEFYYYTGQKERTE